MSGCQSAGPEGDQVIYRAFQIGDLADLIMLDTRLVGRDEQLDYGKGIERAGSVEAFLKNDPTTRAATPKTTGSMVAKHYKAAKPGATWQVLGQQVLMGKLNIPVIPPEELAQLELSDTPGPGWSKPSSWPLMAALQPRRLGRLPRRPGATVRHAHCPRHQPHLQGRRHPQRGPLI